MGGALFWCEWYECGVHIVSLERKWIDCRWQAVLETLIEAGLVERKNLLRASLGTV